MTVTIGAMRGGAASPERALRLGADAVGGKAHALARLTAAGERVPAWVVLPAETLATLLRDAGRLDDVEHELAALAAVDGEASATREAVRRASRTLQAIVDGLAPRAALRDLLAGVEGAVGRGPYAVRSSAIGEDGEAHSFAGQLDTVLGVSGAGLDDAVFRCWRSAFGERVLDYRRRAGSLADGHRIAVVVQQMIDGEVSGVLFTRDPVSGDASRMRASAVAGLGEALVSGEADADEYLLSHDGEALDVRPSSGAPLLDAPQLRAIAALGRRVAGREGGPRDIEWTMRGGELFALQARPITSPAPAATRTVVPETGHRIVWDNSNIQESYCGVTTPLTFSFASAAYASVYEQTMRVLGVGERTIARHRPQLRTLLGLLRGRVYYNLNSWYGCLLLLPSFRRNKDDMERMMGVEEPVDFVADAPSGWGERLRRLPQVSRTAARLLVAFARLDRDAERFLARFDASIARVDRATLPSRPLGALMAILDELREECIERWTTPIVNDLRVMMATGRLRRLVERARPGDADAVMQELVGGADVAVSAGPAMLMLRLAQAARADGALAAALERADPADALRAACDASAEFARTLDELLRTYGDRCMGELKLESRPLRDDPAFVVRMIRNYLTSAMPDPARLAEGARLRRAAAERTVLARLSPLARARFRRAVVEARRAIRAREAMRLARTRLFGTHRDVYRAIGQRLHERRRLERADDVLYLTIEEIRAHWEGTAASSELAALARSRRAEFARYEREHVPNRIVTTGTPCEALDALPGRTAAPPAAAAGRVLQGLGCSPGVAEGRVRIVRSPADDLSLDGHVLVAPRTDPGWAPLFPSSCALIVERGSLLSHSAVLARELGIPAVTGIPGATDLLRDGELVRVDGNSGTIVRLEDR